MAHRRKKPRGVTLSEEYRRLNRAFGWGADEFRQCNRNALAAAFLDGAARRALAYRLNARAFFKAKANRYTCP